MLTLLKYVFLFPPDHSTRIYQPLPLRPHLKETRLIILEKGDWNDVIHCRLEVVALGTRPSFEALSYVWGNSTTTQTIQLNGHSVQIGANLEAALRRLRKSNRARALWADAVSVNQRDTDERNEQVALMRDICFQCQRVLVWLGDGNDTDLKRDARVAVHEWMTDFTHWSDSPVTHEDDQYNMTVFRSRVQAYYRLPFVLRHNLNIDTLMGAFSLIHLLAQNKHVNRFDIPLLSNHDAFHRVVLRLEKIMTRSWRTRQWVIQEVVLPLKVVVHYENYVAPWEMMARAARKYEHHRTGCCDDHYTSLHWNDIRLLEHFSRTIVGLDDLRQEWQKLRNGQDGNVSISLRRLLWQFRARNTSDARDRVYTLLPLVNSWGNQMPMYPDYNWSSQQVYRATVEKVFDMDESLLVLMGTMEKSLPGLPSWVPDWTTKPSKFELERLERVDLFNASGDRRPCVKFIDNDFIELEGVYFDKIVAVSDVMNYDDEERTHQIFASWYVFVSTERPDTPENATGVIDIETYWRTLCMDTSRRSGPPSIPDALHQNAASLSRRYRRCTEDYMQESMKRWMDEQGVPKSHMEVFDITDEDPPRSPDDIANSLEGQRHDEKTVAENDLNFVSVDFAIVSAIDERKLFFTSKGYMGLGSSTVAKGDLVHVFAGGTVPFVIRGSAEHTLPQTGRHMCYKLLGDCYVHGIMDGELMEDYERQKVLTISLNETIPARSSCLLCA